jgi:hypothetical protein
MAAKGYSTAALIQAEVGSTLSTEEAAAVNGLLEEAESSIDRITGEAWLLPASIVETHAITGSLLFLQRRPIASITSVVVRPPLVGAAPTTLVAGVGYELLDAATGTVRLAPGFLGMAPGYVGFLATVTYAPAPDPTLTPAGPSVPPDIREAATLLVAERLQQRRNAALYAASAAGMSGYRIGPDLEVQFQTLNQMTAAALPPRLARAKELLANRTRSLVFA